LELPRRNFFIYVEAGHMGREANARPMFPRHFLSFKKAKENNPFQPMPEKLLKGT